MFGGDGDRAAFRRELHRVGEQVQHDLLELALVAVVVADIRRDLGIERDSVALGAPAYERQRWAEPLVRAVLDRYRLDAHAGSLWIYVPR